MAGSAVEHGRGLEHALRVFKASLTAVYHLRGDVRMMPLVEWSSMLALLRCSKRA